MTRPSFIQTDAPLGADTTLEVGGRARFLAECLTPRDVRDAVSWAHAEGLAVQIVAGGSNMIVADAGFDGLALRYVADGVRFEDRGELVHAHVAAGHPWDALVAKTVAMQLRGVAALSGIPGHVGAAPIQNIGAYGQELADVLVHLDAIDLTSLAPVRFTRDACAFGYRESLFKRTPNRWLVVGVTLALRTVGEIPLRYGPLRDAFPDGTDDPAAVAAKVLELRRGKSMVYDPADPNHRSAGSFFTNPVVPTPVADAIAIAEMPRYPAEDGHVKLSAAWLIERAGLAKGTVRGRVGLSSRHTLALINRGDATTDELLAFAREVQQTVYERFAVWLTPEPVRVGFDRPPLALRPHEA